MKWFRPRKLEFRTRLNSDSMSVFFSFGARLGLLPAAKF